MESGCQALHEKGIKIVLVTLGSKGCFVSHSGQQYLVPAYEIDAVDTTGAGDSFIGSVLFKCQIRPKETIFMHLDYANLLSFQKK